MLRPRLVVNVQPLLGETVKGRRSGLDSDGAGDGEDCSEGFELHFRVGGNITASDEVERKESKEEMRVSE